MQKATNKSPLPQLYAATEAHTEHDELAKKEGSAQTDAQGGERQRDTRWNKSGQDRRSEMEGKEQREEA